MNAISTTSKDEKKIEQQQGIALLKALRLLNSEEQRIACAVLDGMRLQKQLDAQRMEQEKESENEEGKV